MSANLSRMTIADAAAHPADRFSALEWVEAYLARIAALDGALHAYLHVAAAAVTAARAADAAIAESGRNGPLFGAPVAIKDVIDVAGMPTTANSALAEGAAALEDAIAVRRLRDGGAIVLGKLAAWEFAVGGVSFDLPWPPARNPWDLDRDPGGSSTGAAVAVAAGLCAGAIGTDTGGSIREPAAWCGLAGLKPTFGVVERRGVWPVSTTLDHVGPMAWTSEDCALMLDAIANSNPRRAPASYSKGIGAGVAGLRIGLLDLDSETRLPLENAVAAELEEVARLLGRLGAAVKRARIAPLAVYNAVVTIIAAAESYEVHKRRLAATPYGYDALTRQRLLSGASVRTKDYVRAQRERLNLIADQAELMNDVDALVMPTTAGVAPKLGAFDSHAGHPSLTRPWNVTGNPALTVCAGFSPEGLPVGAQIIGRPFEDAVVLRVGHALEKATGTRAVRPPEPPPMGAPAATPRRSDRRHEFDADQAAITRLVRHIDLAAELIACRGESR
jgi:aspartyl-tRNA(Asn)/glutamyl-tRNA(Gln) amidotransferase subunit A